MKLTASVDVTNLIATGFMGAVTVDLLAAIKANKSKLQSVQLDVLVIVQVGDIKFLVSCYP